MLLADRPTDGQTKPLIELLFATKKCMSRQRRYHLSQMSNQNVFAISSWTHPPNSGAFRMRKLHRHSSKISPPPSGIARVKVPLPHYPTTFTWTLWGSVWAVPAFKWRFRSCAPCSRTCGSFSFLEVWFWLDILLGSLSRNHLSPKSVGMQHTGSSAFVRPASTNHSYHSRSFRCRPGLSRFSRWRWLQVGLSAGEISLMVQH